MSRWRGAVRLRERRINLALRRKDDDALPFGTERFGLGAVVANTLDGHECPRTEYSLADRALRICGARREHKPQKHAYLQSRKRHHNGPWKMSHEASYPVTVCVRVS